jgi:hypothetical protein
MADSIMSITVRDPEHPCAPYQKSKHPFVAQILHCDGKPLHWKGLDGASVPLQSVVPDGPLIHGQFRVPPGCYLVRAVNPWNNVISDWAWVQACCNQTVCVNLLIGPLGHCIKRMISGLRLGGAGDGGLTVAELMPRKVQAAVTALEAIAEELLSEPELPDPPTVKEIEKIFKPPKPPPDPDPAE